MVTSIVFSVIAAMAQQERLTLIDRTMAGLRTAKRKAGSWGVRVAPSTGKDVNSHVASEESVRSVVRSLDVSHGLLLKGLQA